MLKNGEFMEIGFVLENGEVKKDTGTRFFGMVDLYSKIGFINESRFSGWEKFYVSDICWFDKKTGILGINPAYINFSDVVGMVLGGRGVLDMSYLKYGDDMYVLDKGELCKCDKTPKAKPDKPTDVVVTPEVVQSPTTTKPKSGDIIVEAEIVETTQSQQKPKEEPKPVTKEETQQKPKEEPKPPVKEQPKKDDVPNKPKENKKPDVVDTVSSERMFEFTTQWDKNKPVKKAGKINIGFVSEKSDLRSHVLPMLSQVHCTKFTGEDPRFTMTNVILQTIEVMRKSSDMTMYGNTLKGAHFSVMETEVGKYVINTDLAVIGTNKRLVIHVDVVAKTVFAQVV